MVPPARCFGYCMGQTIPRKQTLIHCIQFFLVNRVEGNRLCCIRDFNASTTTLRECVRVSKLIKCEGKK